MTTYANTGGDSGISAYQYGKDWIRVEFSSGGVYTYTYSSTGSSAIETMKSLADQGEGLHSYISTNKPGFNSKC